MNVQLDDCVRVHINKDQELVDAFYNYILRDPEGQKLLGYAVRGVGSSGMGSLIDFYDIEARPLLEKFFSDYTKKPKPCGTVPGKEEECACGCTAYDARCDIWSQMCATGVMVESHTCCKPTIVKLETRGD